MKTFVKKHLTIVTIIAAIIYISWRLIRTIPFQYGILSTTCGLILFFVELGGILEMIVHFYQLSRSRLPTRPKVDPIDYPDVDIFISTYNEPPELLYKTINGCLNMDYPDKSKVHIYLCDDGHREEMGVLAKHMGVTHLVRDTHQFAKAGNLNHALSVTSSPYIVTFDADMIPKHDFLTACIPYFLGEEKIGFLQTPQTFYNPDLFQFNLYSEERVPNEQDYFYRDVQVMRNASNTVIYGGTNTILSRQALQDAGGFYTGVITEDFATGIMIQSKGYRCYAINESYACGMAPQDLKSLIKQRQRWARGCIQTGRKMKILFMRGLNLNQKINYITSITYWFGPLKRFIYILAPILYAVFNIIVVKCTVLEVLIFWLPMYLLNNTSLHLMSGNIRNSRITNIYETAMVPALLLSVILESFGISQKKFVVTKKDRKQTRDAGGFWFKFRTSLLLQAFLVLCMIGLARCVEETFLQATPSYLVILFWLSVNFYYLLLSIFFIFGRQQHREFERFKAEIDCLISYQDRVIRTKTYDISERGISVILNFPEYIPPDENITVQLATDRYETCWTGKVVNVINAKDKWKYGFQYVTATEENYRGMLLIVYDRNPSLPKEIEDGLSAVDDITMNIWHRMGSNTYFNNTLPIMELGNFMETSAGEKLMLVRFNYELLTVQFFYGEKIPQRFSLIEHGVEIKCELESDNAKDGICYRVLNLNALINNTRFRASIKSWMHDYEVGLSEKNAFYKQLDSVLERYEIFNELEYL